MEVCPGSMDLESVDATSASLDASAAYPRPCQADVLTRHAGEHGVL